MKTILYDYLEQAAVCVTVVVLVFSFCFRLVTVSGSSMEPTLHNGDFLLLSRLLYQPRQGDIVVLAKPNAENHPYIKRVIALGGQTVDIDFGAGEVWVDGQLLDEPYVAGPTYLEEGTSFPLTVPPGEVFVLGDNRNHSKDSRDPQVGTFHEGYILGKYILKVYPFSEFGPVSPEQNRGKGGDR